MTHIVEAAVTEERIVAPTGAKLELEFAMPQDLSSLTLSVDEDGDGTWEQAIPFYPPIVGSAAEDESAPHSSIDVRRFTAEDGMRMAEVLLAASDTGGSGVARIEYALDADETSSVYTGPFVVPAEGELYVRAIDMLGNIESPYQVAVLDDYPGRFELVSEFNEPPFVREGFISRPGDVDWIGISIADTGPYSYRLAKVPGDFDLALFDSSGNLLAEGSHSLGLEVVSVLLSEGRYLARVTGRGGSYDYNDPYRLVANKSVGIGGL